VGGLGVDEHQALIFDVQPNATQINQSIHCIDVIGLLSLSLNKEID